MFSRNGRVARIAVACREAVRWNGSAEWHGRTPAQIVLRWQVQQEGVVAIPRSSNAERIAQNLRVFDFALEAGEMAALDALRVRQHRICDFDFSPEWDAA